MTDAELNRLGESLKACKGGKAMNLAFGNLFALYQGERMAEVTIVMPPLWADALADQSSEKNKNNIVMRYSRHLTE